ncbi:MAG: sulfotransferase [Thiocapsa sp.]|nr:sulfotransferase [Thiocapsa sp.]MCG6984617.1 sulfotransferase [Thiocapsa sp.]
MLIAGSGRSGTTWVLDVLASAFGLRTIFEPLHPNAVKGAQAYASRFIPPDAEPDGMERFFRRVFSGELATLWTDYRIPPYTLIPPVRDLRAPGGFARLYHCWLNAIRQYQQYQPARSRPRLLVKCIRANLLLGWIASRFDARVLLLVRHPAAVVESKLRLGGRSWDPARILDVYKRDENLPALGGGRYVDLLHKDLTDAEALALVWCIENQVPMAEARENGYLLVHYEDLVGDGGQIWDRIANFFGLEASGWDTDLIRSPSQQASADFKKAEGPRQASRPGWMTRMRSEDLRDVDGILKAVGLTAYDVNEAFPTQEAEIRS